ncbi:hypothetical protein, partial [Eisenbergiella porci]|uniref:hypothetical protein n=1 Tax=Eisenbergiella porci TaxID=2652274 RepID=UPI003A8D2092
RRAHQAAQLLLVHAKARAQLFHPVLQRHRLSSLFASLSCHFDNYYCQTQYIIDNFICQWYDDFDKESCH